MVLALMTSMAAETPADFSYHKDKLGPISGVAQSSSRFPTAHTLCDQAKHRNGGYEQDEIVELDVAVVLVRQLRPTQTDIVYDIV